MVFKRIGKFICPIRYNAAMTCDVRSSADARPTISKATSPQEAALDPFGTLCRTSAVALCAMVGGLLAAVAVYRWAPLSDPVDVVGLPLLTGYCESNEQWSFYAFVFVALLLSYLFRRMSRTLPQRVLLATGGVGVLIPLSLTAWSISPRSLPPATLVGVLAFLAGAAWERRRDGSRTLAHLTTAFGLVVWGIGFPELPMSLARRWSFVLAVVTGLLVLRWLRGKIPSRWLRTHSGWPHLAAGVLGVCGTLTANRWELMLGLAGGLVFALGAAAGRTRVGGATFASPQWLAGVAVLAVIIYPDVRWLWLDVERPLLAVAGGAAAAAMVANVAAPAVCRDVCDAVARSGLKFVFPCLAIAAVGLVALSKPWLGGVIFAVSLGLLIADPRRKWHGRVAAALTGVLFLTFLPGASHEIIDSFHDGSVLSGVWEFESGRALYSEVFPLRGYEFFVTWLSRLLLAPTFANYFFTSQLLVYLPVSAACLATFAWTRSYWWSFATGLAIAACPHWWSLATGLAITVCPHSTGISGRMGVPLCLAAVGVYVLRSPNWRRIIWLAATGGVVGFLGHDMFVTFVGSLTLAAFFVGPSGVRPQLSWRDVTSRVGGAALYFLIAVLPFTVSLALWQGPKSVFAYWSLLLDNVRNYAAHCGLPLPWFEHPHREVMIFSLVVIGLWATAGAVVWGFQQGWRGKAWLFLLILLVLSVQRGVARSHINSLAAALYPSILLASIGVFECLRFLRIRANWTIIDYRAIALVASAIACWLTPHGSVTPNQFLRNSHDALTRNGPSLAPSPFVLSRVAEDEHVWEMESAFLSFANQRHNSARHPLTYCISSPDEQRRVVAAFQERPPKLVAWQYACGSDRVPNPLRFYVISQFLYSNYRPAPESLDDPPATGWQLVWTKGSNSIGFHWTFLEPAPAGWQGQESLGPAFKGVLRLDFLPLRWGQKRIPQMAARIQKRQNSLPWNACDEDGLLIDSDTESAAGWRGDCPVSPRVFNYIKIELACHADDLSKSHPVMAILEFAPREKGFEKESRITFVVLTDGVKRPYLIPIGCSPGWSWRPHIEDLRLQLPDGTSARSPRVEFWSVDELSPGPH